MKKLLTFLILLSGGVLVFAQDVITLDEAIKVTAKTFIESNRLEDEAKLGVLSVESTNKALSEYIIDHLTTELINGQRFINILSRNDQIQKLRDAEFDYQENGNVDERTRTDMGEALGLDIIISGKIVPGNDGYEMTISGTTLGSSKYLVQRSTKIKKSDKKIAGFDDAWRTRRVYIGVRGGLAMDIFDLGRTAGIYGKGAVKNNPNISFNAAGEFAYQFSNWASAQVELLFTTGKMEWQYGNDTQTINSTNILVPLLFKPTFYINNWYLSPFVGGYLNMSWGNYEYFEEGSNLKGKGDVVFDVMGGAVVGGAFGIRAGPGIVFLDLRYLIDLGRTRPNSVTGGSMIYGQKQGDTVYTQQMVMASVGYRIGFGGGK